MKKTLQEILQWINNQARNDMIVAADRAADNEGTASTFYTGRAQAFREVGGYLEWLIKNDEIEVKEENN